MQSGADSSGIAIVGIGCRFPGGASTPERFWRLLCDGVDAITEIPPDRFDLEPLFDPDPSAPGKLYTRWGGFVDGVAGFDADFFGIAPREARRMDPQHRMLLEVVWEALDDGGQVPERLAGTRTAVFVGIASHDYGDLQAGPGRRHLIDAHVNIGSALSAAPNRISYLLDLHGPSLAVETACSSSLTALHLACRSIRSGESHLAIVGGVNLVLTPEPTIGFCKASMISPDGRCRAFDAQANGYVRSEGAGAVVLKPFERALTDGDRIYAIIRGSAINEDGRTAGISLPSGEAQEAVLRQALRDAGLAGDAVQYVEAHGTGTVAGDPIEAGALGCVFGSAQPGARQCLIGSVKTNIGHLEAGAGIAGVIKTALALKYRQVPPSLHFQEPNPAIPFDELRLRVPTRLEPWPETSGPARAGVNSFGFGGSNAHVLLEEPPAAAPTAATPHPRPDLLTLSARSPEALRALAERYVEHLGDDAGSPLEDVAYTAATRRTHYEHRLAVVAGRRSEMVERLGAFLRGEERADVLSGRTRRSGAPRLAFVFSGMGPQWWGMGRGLLETEPVYRRTLEDCDRILRPLAGWSLLEELGREEADSRIADADVAHVANCALQVALAALWRWWGIEPDLVTGHSSGEIAAAHVAGVLGLSDALHLAYHRGRLQHTLSGTGGMLAAGISPDEARRLLQDFEDRVSLAAVNSAESVTLSGEVAALDRIAVELERRERFCRLLRVEVPYHAPQMEAIHEPLLEELRHLSPQPAAVPFVSALTGERHRGPELDAGYWWRNVRETVRFDRALDRLLDEGCEIFLEVGPHPVVSAYIAEALTRHGRSAPVLPTLRRREDDRSLMLRSLAALYVSGRPVHWPGVYREGACVSLPAYPWQRERYWLEPAPDHAGSPGVDTGHPLLGRRLHSPHPAWEGDLDDPRSRYLDEHLVQGSIVFPGAGYVEMMLSAAARLWPDAAVSLEDVSFRKLLFLESPHARLLQLHYRPLAADVEIHSAAKAEPADWTLHATARLRRHEDTGAPRRIDLDAALARCTEEIEIEEHFRALVPRGIHYGQAFHGLQELRFGQDEAVARITFPADVELPTHAYRIHPALLDAAFQVFALAVIRDRADERSPGPVFPVGITKATLRAAPGDSFRAYVVGRRSEGRLSEGDLFLLDDAGDVVASFEGFRMRVLDQLRPQVSPDSLGSLYRLDWEELPAEAASAPATPRLRSPREVRDAVEAASAPPERDPLVFGYFDVAARLDRIARGYAAAALMELGWRPDAHAGADAVELMEACGVVARHRRLFPALMRMASRRPTGGGSLGRPVEELGAELDELGTARPAHLAECELLRRGGEHLADVLRGRTDPREILLSGEALDILGRLYHASPECRSYSALVADAVSAAIAEASPAAPVRVLEIGGGTGSATEAILPRQGEGVEYVFTDISPYFVAQARTRFGDGPARRFEVLDIERDPAENGWEPHTFDLVVAADVLHATADLRTSLRHVRRLLKPGGLAVILELVHRADWFNLVFGLLDGWWRFADHDVRREWPLLGPGEWRRVLEESGFREATALFDGEPEGPGVQTVVLARAPEHPVAAPAGPHRRWLLLGDDHGVAEGLAAALRERGDRCVLAAAGDSYGRLGEDRFEVAPDDPAALARLLEESRPPDGSMDGVVHLWSLDAPPVDAQDTASLVASQRLGCASALALVQALERVPVPALWLVTAGAQPVEREDAVPRLSQATLWGLGRVVMNEHGDLRCRLVDLAPVPTAEELHALARLMCGNDAEEEVALRGERRSARRLRRAPLEAAARRETPRMLSSATDAFRLESDTPGALDTLRLRDAPWAEPGPGEVSLRVEASGLAFRDVLQALGMYPEELLRSQPDPRALGADCAGVVLSCGEGVTGVRPGDEVIAVATGAHGSRVVAPAHLVVRKPAALSFAEAASIINAFVTAKYSLQHVARIGAGEGVLIHSAAGGVGLAAVQVCRAAGAEVFATAGTAEKRAYLASLGVDHVMDSRSLTFAEEVRARTGGEGVDVVLNSLAGEAMRASLELLRPYGRFVELGKRDIYDNAQLALLPFQRNLSYSAVDLALLGRDRPRLANALMREVVQEVTEGRWTLLPRTEFDLADAESAFRLMAQARHIGKVVLVVGRERYDVLTGDDRPLWCPDATYLIAGGLGGFGLAAAEWLVAHGATSIVLMSRSGVPKEDTGALERLQASTAQVVVMRGDVGVEGDVRRVLDSIRRELPPLKGVIHAAMVLHDRMLGRIETEELRDVLSPKVAGAWNLHRLTLGDDLDHFILFSSLASVMGHPMQGSYAAANAFLDALASHRRAAGLPALAIGWGAVAGAGYVARHPKVAEYLGRSGSGAFTAAEALETMEALLRHDLAHVVAARIDWSRWAQGNPVMATSGRYASLVATPAGHAVPTRDHPDSPLDSLRNTPPERRQEALEAYLIPKLASVLGGDPQKIDLERPLTELGFDSLMAVELVTALHSGLGIKLPVVKILQGVSGRGLAETLLGQVAFDGAPSGDATESVGVAGEEAAPAADLPEAVPLVAGPLSFEQRRFWFLDRLSPGDPAYNLFAAARLVGALDQEALQRGIDEVVGRHDVLRASFPSVDGEPRLAIARPAHVPLALRDLRHLPRAKREAELRQLAGAEIQKPFDLGRGPLVRAALFRLAEEEHAILLIVHHAVADAWSMTLLVREIMTVYGAASRGEPAALPDPEKQYTEYVRTQREALGDGVQEAQLAYWRDRLADLPRELGLPADRARPDLPSWRGGHLRFDLPSELSESLRELGARNGVTLFTTLLAAFQTLLHRYSGRHDICVGTPVAARGRPGEDALVGCCMNTLVIRTDLAGDPPFRELLGRAREATLGAFEHQDVPFERVVEAVAPRRRALRSPLYQAMLVLHNLRWPELALPGLIVEPLEVESGTAACDLMLLVDTGERLRCTLEYSADLFDAPTVARMSEHLRVLLQGIVADPGCRISELPLIPEAEQRVLADWNATGREFSGPWHVHELVEAQAWRTPEAVAVGCGDTSLTYAELDRRANRLAERLRRLGVRPDDPVAVHAARSPRLLVGALAILKAGGAYLPLDPEQPLPRLSTILEDARPRVLLTDARWRARLAAPGMDVVLLDRDVEASGGEPAAIREAGATAGGEVEGGPGSDSLAYVLYTSGTTGRPKGVGVPHRAICNQMHWRQAEFPLSPDDVVLQRTPLGFDPSVWELFGPLAAGARLLLAPEGHDGDPAELVRLISAHRVTTLQVVPALLGALAEEPHFRGCRSLARIFCGGDVLPPRLVSRVRETAPWIELVHLYGPTEAAIDATFWRCRDAAGEERESIPIGRPIANARVYVVDDALRQVPIGVPGELCIGGAGVARGYVAVPDLTRERFVPDPFDTAADARLYRTGDRGRVRADGAIEFLGRLDDQVKLRGTRIEPGEVQAALERHPAVAEAAVLAMEDARGESRLVAYVVTAPGQPADGRALRRFLQGCLPKVMIPAAFVPLEKLPRAANGKLDREALPRPSRAHGRRRVIVQPRDPLELRLLALWEELLGVAPVGVTDDFFALGGHSLLAARLAAEVRSSLGVELPLAAVFAAPTIEELAQTLREETRPLASRPVIALQPGGEGRAFFCVAAPTGAVWRYLPLARRLGARRAVYALTAPGGEEATEPPGRIEEMADACIEALRSVQPEGPYLLGGWSMGGTIAFEMARRLEAGGQEVGLLALLDSRAAPPDPAALAASDRAALLLRLLHDLGLDVERFAPAADRFWTLEPDAQLAVIFERARAAELVPAGSGIEELRRHLELLESSLTAFRRYRPGPYGRRITVIRAETPRSPPPSDPSLGWAPLAADGVAVYSAPGDHDSMLREPHVRVVARTLRSLLDAADRAPLEREGSPAPG